MSGKGGGEQKKGKEIKKKREKGRRRNLLLINILNYVHVDTNKQIHKISKVCKQIQITSYSDIMIYPLPCLIVISPASNQTIFPEKYSVISFPLFLSHSSSTIYHNDRQKRNAATTSTSTSTNTLATTTEI